MKRKTKNWLGTGASLILVGLILYVGAMTALKWDYAKMSTIDYVSNTHEIKESFRNISLKTDEARIVFALSKDGKCRVECYEEAKAVHAVAVKEATLSIEMTHTRSWYDYIGIHYESPKITVYLPKQEYNALSINLNVGNIEIENKLAFTNADIRLSTGNVNYGASTKEAIHIQIGTGNISVGRLTAGSLDISSAVGTVAITDLTCKNDLTLGLTTGTTSLNDVFCGNLVSTATAGEITLDHVIAREKFTIERDTGNIKFKGSDAAEIHVKTNTGNVSGSLLTNKVFLAKSESGKVHLPPSTTGGPCKIDVLTGNIDMEIDEKAE